MSKNKIVTASDQRAFTMVYNDFLRSEVLSPSEKLLFIYLKMHSGNGSSKVFPSLATLVKETGMTRRTVQKWLSEMEAKGAITVEHRQGKRGTESNLYKLRDTARLWQTKSIDEMQITASELKDAELIEYLQNRGYEVTKKEPVSATDQSSDTSTSSKLNNNLSTAKSTRMAEGCQERYSMEDIHTLYDYELLVDGCGSDASDIDTVMQILYDALNTTKGTLRVSGEDKPALVVIGKLMKLSYEEIRYSIRKFKSVTERINNPKAYMLTILYGSKEQMSLDISNQVNHNLYGRADDTE